MKSPPFAIAALLLFATCAPASAGTPINERRAVDANARIDISNVRGAVTISTWDQPEVAISGTLGDGSKGLRVDGGGARLSIKVEPPERSGWGWFNWGSGSRMDDSILDIRLPRQAELKLGVVSAEVTISGSEGRLVEVSSVSGRVRIEGNAREIKVGSVSGSIDIANSGERIQVETVSGEARLRGAASRLKFGSVSGDIQIEADGYAELEASSVSGDIGIGGRAAPGARLDSETLSGDVRVRVPAAYSARIRAETFSGRIRSDFGTVKEPDRGPGRSLETTTGSGDARVNIETFSGDIEIRGD